MLKWLCEFWNKLMFGISDLCQCILYALYDGCKQEWLLWLLCTLCDLEMSFNQFKDKELQETISLCSTWSDGSEISDGEALIPTNTLYCEYCPFQDRSTLARFFFGSHWAGYCHYLKRGDYSFVSPTMILWDGCKECGIGEDIEIDEEEYFAFGETLKQDKVDQNDE